MPTQTVSNLIKSKFVEAACTNILRLFVLNLMLVNALTSASSRDNSNKLNGGGKALGAPGERSTSDRPETTNSLIVLQKKPALM
jgi:hypothetical protein